MFIKRGWCASKCRCCEVSSMCGRSLRDGVLFISTASLIISVITLLTSITSLTMIGISTKQLNNHPLVAVNFIFALVATFLAIYQIIISLLLLWQALKTKGNIFLCSLWYTSQISLLTMYFLLFSVKAIVCFIRKNYVYGAFTVCVGIAYQGIFIYFAIVVNSFLHSLNQERYL